MLTPDVARVSHRKASASWLRGCSLRARQASSANVLRRPDSMICVGAKFLAAQSGSLIIRDNILRLPAHLNQPMLEVGADEGTAYPSLPFTSIYRTRASRLTA